MKLEFTQVAGPYRGHTGGMVWDGQRLLFSSVTEERILAWDPAARSIQEVRRYTGRTNGLALGADGILYGAQEGGRRIVRFMPDGSAAQTADLLDGVHHNQPSDLTLDAAQRIWFTDPHNATPPYGPRVYGFLDHCSILRLTPEGTGWRLERMTRDTRGPRALALAADGRWLYVADEDTRNDTLACDLRAYRIAPDGSLGPARLLHTFPRGERGIEGLCAAPDGKLLACAGSVEAGPGPRLLVFGPEGDLAATHPLPVKLPMRIALGDSARDGLYLTADGALLHAPGGARLV